MRAEPDMAAVGEFIREVAAEVVLPRFQALVEGEVTEKGPGDLVTVADVAGSLLVEEAGGRVARPDGSDYEPWSDRTGLVLAADQATHARAIALLAPDGAI